MEGEERDVKKREMHKRDFFPFFLIKPSCLATGVSYPSRRINMQEYTGQ